MTIARTHTRTHTLHNLFIGGGLSERITLVSAEPSQKLPAGEVASEEIKGHNILLPKTRFQLQAATFKTTVCLLFLFFVFF